MYNFAIIMLSSTLLFIYMLSGISAFPFLYSVPRALTSLAGSASASASSPYSDGNIADLRKSAKLEESATINPDDDFFKDIPEEPQQEIDNNPSQPSFLQTKLNKIVQKIRFLTSLTSNGQPSESEVKDDAFQKEQDEFDKEFEEDSKKSAQLVSTGYKYEKPITKETEKIQLNPEGFTPGAVGVFFMELLGSILGLAYGAAAQVTAVTTPSSA